MMLLLKKENEIYRRHLNLQKKKLRFRKNDKFTLAMLNALSQRTIKETFDGGNTWVLKTVTDIFFPVYIDSFLGIGSG